MPIELQIKGGDREVFSYLRSVRDNLTAVSSSYDLVDEASRKAFGLGKNKDYNKELKRTNGLIEDIEDSIKKWEQKVRKATNVKDLQKYNRKIEEAKVNLREYRNLGVKAFDDVNNKIKKSDGLFSSLNNTIKTAFTAAVFYRAIGEIKDTALSLDVLDKKASTVFGRFTNDVKEVGKATASSLGMTEAEFLKATAATGDLLIPMQFTRKEAATMSTGLITLSGALAEWSAGKYTATEVSEILTKSLLGEREQLKSLGISITEFDVKQKLAEKGQTKFTGASLAQAKALATLELVYQRSSDAQSAFEDNSDSLTRQYYELNARFKTVKENLSSDLIPTFNRFFGYVNKNFEAIKTLAKWLGIGTTAILGYKAGVFVTNGVIKAYTTLTNLATVATKTFDKATKTTLVGVLAGLLTSAAAAFLIFRDNADEATDSLSDMDDELDSINRNLGKNIYSNLVYGWDNATKTFTGSIEKLKGSISTLSKSELESLKLYLEEAINNTKLLGDESSELERNLQTTELSNYKEALKHINKELKLFGDKASPQAVDGYAKLKQEIKDLEKQLRQEIMANDDNAASTARLIIQKKEELEVIENTAKAMTKVLGIKKLVTRKANLNDKQENSFFTDDDGNYIGLNLDEQEVYDQVLDGMIKYGEVLSNAAGNATSNMEKSWDDFEIPSIWEMMGFDPDNPQDAAFISSMQEYVNQAIGIIGQLIDAERQAADEKLALTNTLIAEKQREIQAEISLNEQGYASNIQMKQKELATLKLEREKALRDQEKAKKKQLLLDSVIQASSLLTTSAKLIESAVKAMGIKGLLVAIPLVGAMFGMFAASKIKANKLTKLKKGRTGLLRGKSHEEGGELFEVEGGEYHSITPKNKAKKHLPLLEAIRVDDKNSMAKALADLLEGTGISMPKELPTELRKKHEAHKLSQAFGMSTEKMESLLEQLVSKSDGPIIDNSDPSYTKYIYSENYEKWIVN